LHHEGSETIDKLVTFKSARKRALLGGESTGRTARAQALAKALNTVWCAPHSTYPCVPTVGTCFGQLRMGLSVLCVRRLCGDQLRSADVRRGSNVRVQRHEQLTFDRPSALEALASTGYGCSTLRAVAGDATYRGSVNGRNVAETVNSSGRHVRRCKAAVDADETKGSNGSGAGAPIAELVGCNAAQTRLCGNARRRRDGVAEWRRLAKSSISREHLD